MRRVPIEILEEGDDGVARLDGEPFTGCAYEEASGPRMPGEVEFVDGLQHGLARDWHLNGQLHGCTEYRSGVRHGLDEEWFENGRKAMEARYEHNILLEKVLWDKEGRELQRYRLREDDPLFSTLQAFRKTSE
jgi:antitoxin component YwqK of YwqJK toxin-antitoxin module